MSLDLPHLQMWLLALRRRARRALGCGDATAGDNRAGFELSPSATLRKLVESAPRTLAFTAATEASIESWQHAARTKLSEIIGFKPDGSVPSVARADRRAHPSGLTHDSYILDLNHDYYVPVDVFRSGATSRPYEAMICLTGTNVGAHCAWGEVRNPADPVKIANGLDIAIQAAKRGYVAVVVEQMGFGERAERRLQPVSPSTGLDAAHHALLVGRTLLGLWVGDISSVVTWLSSGGAGTTLNKIYAMGHSAGGTTALFAAAVDTRIDGVIASGCVGSWTRNIARRRDPEGQLALPGILNWLEMADVLGLVAPRPLVVVAGETDHIWPFPEAARVVNEATPCFAALGARQRLVAIAGREGHRFYPDLAWTAFANVLGQGTT